MTDRPLLPPDITVFERGWLSSNNVLIRGRSSNALIDSGYCTHAAQTVALVEAALEGHPLDVLLNTHLHSDHCGGNASLQAHYPGVRTLIPPGLSEHVRNWDPYALTFTPTGQSCPEFVFDAVLVAGTQLTLGDRSWQIHAAPGHDPHSVILFEPLSRVLVSADALWERGFGVVFPELEGADAFAAVGQTIDLIESLDPLTVIPGHGSAFSNPASAIAVARERLRNFVKYPDKHVQYAAKVLLKFKLLEVQRIDIRALESWTRATPYFELLHKRHFRGLEFGVLVGQLVQALVKTGAAARHGDTVQNLG